MHRRCHGCAVVAACQWGVFASGLVSGLLLEFLSLFLLLGLTSSCILVLCTVVLPLIYNNMITILYDIAKKIRVYNWITI